EALEMADQTDERFRALEAKVAELEALINLALRLLALEKPVSRLLERYGATETEELAVHALLDDLAHRAQERGIYAPSFRSFVDGLAERLPAVRGDRPFVSLLLDTLKVDRAAYQQLHGYVVAQGWPQWT